MGLFLDSQFHAIDLYVCIYANTTLSYHDSSCAISFGIQKCESSNFIILFQLLWLLWVPCTSIWILGSASQFLQKSRGDFDKDCIESIDQFVEYCHLNISHPTHEPFIRVFRNYFQWYFAVFSSKSCTYFKSSS